MKTQTNILSKLTGLTLAAALLLGACATAAAPSAAPTEAPAEAPTEAPAAAPTEAPAAAEPVVIKVGAANEQKYLGENTTLEVIFEDTAGTKEQAITAFEKLINQDQVVAILGPTLSNSAFAADPIAQEAGVPVIGSSNTATGITEMGDFVFRTSLPESAVIPNTIKVVKEARGLTKVAVMYGNDDQFTKSGYEVFAAALEAEGIEVLGTETFAKGDTDFSAQLTKIKALEPQAIVTSALAEEAANIMAQASQLGLEVFFIGGNGFNSPKLAEIAGPAAEGAISGSAWFLSSPSPENVSFVEAYKAAYNADPDQFAAQAYTAAWVLAKAIKDAGSADRKAIRDALAQIKDFATPLGVFSFDEARDPLHTPVVLIVQDGKFALFEK